MQEVYSNDDTVVVDTLEAPASLGTGTFLEIDATGRFNLNAVHHHFGMDQSKKVSAWAKMKCTQALIDMAQTAQDKDATPVLESIGPKHRPTTFVSRLLLLNYAKWHGDDCYRAVCDALEKGCILGTQDKATEPEPVPSAVGPIAFVPEDLRSPEPETPTVATNTRQSDTAPAPEIRLNPALGDVVKVIETDEKETAPAFDLLRAILGRESTPSAMPKKALALERVEDQFYLSTATLSAFIGMPHAFVSQFVDVYRKNFQAMGELRLSKKDDQGASIYQLSEAQALLLVSYLPTATIERDAIDLRVQVIQAFERQRVNAPATDLKQLALHLRAAADMLDEQAEREKGFKTTIAILQREMSHLRSDFDEQVAQVKTLTRERDEATEKARRWIESERAAYQGDTESGGYTLSQAAKVMGWKPMTFIAWLEDNKWVFRRQASMPVEPYQERIDQGMMLVRMMDFEDENGTSRIEPQARITMKGLRFFD